MLLKEINLEVFQEYCSAFHSYPIDDVRLKYHPDFLAKLDEELSLIDKKYEKAIIEKCHEILIKFANVRQEYKEAMEQEEIRKLIKKENSNK